jgi:hypothetical protein
MCVGGSVLMDDVSKSLNDHMHLDVITVPNRRVEDDGEEKVHSDKPI